MDAHCTQGGLRKVASRWYDDDSSGTHLSTMVHLVPPTHPNLASRHRATAAEGVPTRPSTTVSMAIAAQSIHLRSASHRPWTRGGANGGPSKEQSLWRCWLQTELTFRTGSGFSARPRDGSEMRMADLYFYFKNPSYSPILGHGHTWKYQNLVVVVGTWTTVVPTEITKINTLFCFPQ